MELWISTVCKSINGKNATAVIECLPLPKYTISPSHQLIINLQPQEQQVFERTRISLSSTSSTDAKLILSKHLESPSNKDSCFNFGKLLESYLCLMGMMAAGGNGDHPVDDVFESYFSLAMGFNYAFDDAWMLPIAKHVYVNLINYAFMVDKYLTLHKLPAVKVGNACIALDALRGKMIDRNPFPKTRKAGILFVANMIFKCYLFLNNLSQLQKVLDYVFNHVLMTSNSTEEQQFQLIDQHFSASERSTFHFYVGKFYLLMHDIVKSRSHLEKAFKTCHKSHMKNRRLILIYLLASKMIMGQFPQKSTQTGRYPLLVQFNLEPQYHHLIESLKLGNIKVFTEALDSPHPQQFIMRKHIYNVLKWRCQLVLYRNLIKRIYIIGSDSTYGYSKQTTTFTSPQLPVSGSLDNLSNTPTTSSTGTATNQPPRISFKDIATGLLIAGDEMFLERLQPAKENETTAQNSTINNTYENSQEQWWSVMVIGLLCRLCEAGFLKGNVMVSNGCVVVSRLQAFPVISKVDRNFTSKT